MATWWPPATTFLSTPSARRATGYTLQAKTGNDISIHALREEGDKGGHTENTGLSDFYPRPPRGGRPAYRRSTRGWIFISIHALREEGDRRCPTIHLREEHFYPRPPRGGRRRDGVIRARRKLFLSTPSARRATVWPLSMLHPGTVFLSTPSARRATFFDLSARPGPAISIHALREEGDLLQRWGGVCRMDFYPRPPRGGRP